MKYVVCLHLYIPWKFGERGLLPAELGGRVSLFCMFVRHAKMLGTESLDGAYTHWTWGNGHKPPDSFSFRYSFRFRSSFRSRFRSSSTTSGDIFYCSGSRQLNHSSCKCTAQFTSKWTSKIYHYFVKIWTSVNAYLLTHDVLNFRTTLIIIIVIVVFNYQITNNTDKKIITQGC